MKVLLFFCFCMPEEAGIPVRVSAERKTTMELLADLFGNVRNLTVPMVLMWIIGAVLIWLGIRKKMEPALLVPMGFGAIFVNLPLSGAVTQMLDGALTEGPLDILF